MPPAAPALPRWSCPRGKLRCIALPTTPAECWPMRGSTIRKSATSPKCLPAGNRRIADDRVRATRSKIARQILGQLYQIAASIYPVHVFDAYPQVLFRNINSRFQGEDVALIER